MMWRKFALVLICVFTMSSALGCKPGDLEHEIQFSHDSSTLEDWQARLLVDWYSTRKAGGDRTQGIGEIGIFAKSIEGNSPTRRIARERLSNIKRLIDAGGDPTPPVEFVIAEAKRAPNYTDDRVVVYIQPACLKTQSCCPTVPSKPRS
jgi:hypothetical protein